jgi:5-hydroxyisourate hydrolase
MGITTHVLDTSRGRPAQGVAIVLRRITGDAAVEVGRGHTDADGRLRTLTPAGAAVATGTYQLTFDTGDYFRAHGVTAFYPTVTIDFVVDAPGEHYHVPLLLNPFGYSTYRGS